MISDMILNVENSCTQTYRGKWSKTVQELTTPLFSKARKINVLLITDELSQRMRLCLHKDFKNCQRLPRYCKNLIFCEFILKIWTKRKIIFLCLYPALPLMRGYIKFVRLYATAKRT